jgi:hypothetical protein
MVAAVMTLFSITAASTHSQETTAKPESFVRRIYAPYAANNAYSSLGPHIADVFSPQIVSLIRADQKKTPKGYVGSLDFDPICQCQDYDELILNQLRVNRDGSGIAYADVELQLLKSSSQVTRLRLQLIHLPEGWRVDDVEAAHTPTLRSLLTRNKASVQAPSFTSPN